MEAKKYIYFFLLCAGIMLQGCVAAVVGAGAGAGTIAYLKEELKTTYAAPFNETWDAALSALKDLEITVNSTQKDATGGTIEASRADGTGIKLVLKSTGLDTTSVSIRVGILGDENVSRTISSKISENLRKK